jgi:hypothetical protein
MRPSFKSQSCTEIGIYSVNTDLFRDHSRASKAALYLVSVPYREEKPPFPVASVRGYYSESAVRKLAFDGHLVSISETPKGGTAM